MLRGLEEEMDSTDGGPIAKFQPDVKPEQLSSNGFLLKKEVS